MAKINDYNSLASQVINYLDNTAVATIATVDQFIHVAEQNVYRDLRVPTMEARATIQVGGEINSIRIPHNYLETRAISILDWNAVIRPVAWETFVRQARPSVPGIPNVYARDANVFYFDRVPAEPVDVELKYYRSFEDLAPDNDTGSEDPRPFLIVTSDAWLYGALTEAASFIGDDRFDYFLRRYEGAIEAISKSGTDLELSGAPLQVSIGSEDFGAFAYGGRYR